MLTIQNKKKINNKVIASGPYYVMDMQEVMYQNPKTFERVEAYKIDITDRNAVYGLSLYREGVKDKLFGMQYKLRHNTKDKETFVSIDDINDMDKLVLIMGLLV